MLTQVLRDAPRPLRLLVPSLPAELEAVVMRALEKDPARRPQSAGELMTALESLGAQPVAAHASAIATASRSRTSTAVRASVAVATVLAVIADLVGDIDPIKAAVDGMKNALARKDFDEAVAYHDKEVTLRRRHEELKQRYEEESNRILDVNRSDVEDVIAVVRP